MEESQKPKRTLPKRMQRALKVSKRLHHLILERKAREKAVQQKLAVEPKKGDGR